MSRLIDADKLMEELETFSMQITGNHHHNFIVRQCKNSIKRIVDEQPTVDIFDTNVGEWIPADNPPETDETEISDYVLLSFGNFPVPLVGRYELDEEGNGAYYVGDSEKSCISQGYAVNAWIPLPKPYRKE